MQLEYAPTIQFKFIAVLIATGLFSEFAQGALAQTAKPDWQYKSGDIQVPAASASEPKRAFNAESVKAALKYLDDGALAWVRERKCVACHSTGVYLAERTQLTPQFGPPNVEIRSNFVDSIPNKPPEPTIKDGVKTWPDVIFSVWRTLGLAQWDKYVTGKLSAETEKSIRDMLARQSDDGLWTTATKVEIPYIRTDFELGLEALRALKSAPGWLESLADSELKARVEKLNKALVAWKPRNDFEKVQKLQLFAIMPELVSKAEIDEANRLLAKLQQADGGWSTRSFSPVKDWGPNITSENIAMIEAEPDAASPASDPFMTAFAIVLLRESGTPADDQRIVRGLDWLRNNQRESGRWWMKSLYKNTRHYITYIATAQVLRAFAACGQLPKSS